MSPRSPTLAGFSHQAESLCVPNWMVPRPNTPKISACLRHCSRFSGESCRRLGSIALRDRDATGDHVNIGNSAVSSNLIRSASPFPEPVLPPPLTSVRSFGFGVFSRPTGELLPSAYCDIDIGWVDLDGIGDTPRLMCSDNRGAGAGKGIEHDVAGNDVDCRAHQVMSPVASLQRGGGCRPQQCGRNFRPHHVGAYFPPVCGVCTPCPPPSLCCSRVMRAQVRLSGSRTVICSVPQPSQESSILSAS